MNLIVNFRPARPLQDKTSILIDIHFKGKRYKIYPKIKIETDFWNSEKQNCKTGKQYSDGYLINDEIDRLRKDIKHVFENYHKKGIIPEKQDIINEIKNPGINLEKQNIGLTTYAESFIKLSKNAKETKKHYTTSMNMLKRYEQENRVRIRFKDVDMDLYNNLQTWCEENEYSLNTFGGLIKHIRVFMNESEIVIKHGAKGHLHPKFKVLSETTDAVYLNEKELLKIHNLEITWELLIDHFPSLRMNNYNNIVRKIESYKAIKDRFLIGAFTALRVSDFKRLSEINIHDDFIRIKPVKGTKKNEDVIIPVHWVIREIIENGFDWNKKVYDQKINQHIKHIARMAGITDKVSVSVTTAGGEIETKTVEKCELVTTHTARRSGATNMFKAGIPALSIMKITGHRSERNFLKYIKISQEENAEMLKSHPFFRK